MPDVVRGKTTMLEHMLKDNMLDDLYKQGIGFAKYNSYLAKMVKQVAHRYPHMRILEIGESCVPSPFYVYSPLPQFNICGLRAVLTW